MKKCLMRRTAMLLISILVLITACGGVGTDPASGAGTDSATGENLSGADKRDITPGGSAQPDGINEDKTGKENATSGSGTAAGGTDQESEDTGIVKTDAAYLPLLVQHHTGQHTVENGKHTHTVYEEYPVIAVGEYEWGGKVSVPDQRRYDALQSRLDAMNEDFADGSGREWLTGFLRTKDVEKESYFGSHGSVDKLSGNITMYDRTQAQVTRSDEKAVSLFFFERSDVMLSAVPVFYNTCVLDPETGKDIPLSRVVTDMEGFLEVLTELSRETVADAALPEELTDSLKQKEPAYSLWTLDYDGVTVYLQSLLTDDVTNVPSFTVTFREHPELFDEAFMTRPANYMVRMLPGRTYVLPGGEGIAKIAHEPVKDRDRADILPYSLKFTEGKQEHSVHHAKNYPAYYLVHTGGQDFIIEDPPRYETSFSLTVYDPEKDGEGDTVTVPAGFGDTVMCNPDRLLLYDDGYENGDLMLPDMPCTAFGYYRMDETGAMVCDDAFRYLESPGDLTVRQQVETHGYRRHDGGTTPVNKTLTRGMTVKPFRTDRKTFIEFESGGDVFRFDIDRYGEDMKLNGVYTVNMLFEP